MDCPRCHVALADGPCERCGGEFLESSLALALAERAGADEQTLRALAREGSAGVMCPSCAAASARFQLRGEWVDVCTKCGAMWLDAAERARLEVVDRDAARPAHRALPNVSAPLAPKATGVDRAAVILGGGAIVGAAGVWALMNYVGTGAAMIGVVATSVVVLGALLFKS